MKVRGDRAAWAGHALCHGIDDQLFPLDDDGYTALEVQEVAPHEEERARAGVDACPEQALSLDDET